MTTITNTYNGGGSGSKNHLPLLDGGRPYRHTYYSKSPRQTADDEEESKKILAMMGFVFVGIILLLCLICFCVRKRSCREDQHQHAGGGNRTRGASAAVEVVPVPPLVCTYRKADGWPADAACGVCLAELADGEAVRVLPACMHYFHATCVNEWLRAHKTCPFCRAPLVVVSPAAAAAK